MRANKLETALSRDRNIAFLAPADMFFHGTCTHMYMYMYVLSVYMYLSLMT